MIKANLKTKTPCEVILEVEVERENLDAAYEKTFKSQNKYIEIPGFRVGKAPRHLVEQNYKNQIQASTLDDITSAIFRSVIKGNKLVLVTGGRPTEEIDFPAEGSLKFTVEFEVAPSVNLKKYTGLSLTKKKADVSKKDVDKVIDSILEQHASFEETKKDRPVAFGDWIVVNYTGSVDGQEVMKRDDDCWVEVSTEHKSPMPGFADQLVNAKKGELKEFSVTAPADFHKKELVGKNIDFKVSVIKIQEKVIPELTDELVVKVDPKLKTIKELKDAIEKNQLQMKDSEEQRRLRDLAKEKLVNEHNVPLPPSLVQNRTRKLVENEVQKRSRNGETEEQIKNNMEDLQKQMQQMAEYELKSEYILSAIATKENISVTNDDMLPQLQYYAYAFQRDINWVRQMMEKEGHMDSLYETAKENKALDKVIEKADVKEK